MAEEALEEAVEAAEAEEIAEEAQTDDGEVAAEPAPAEESS